MRLAGLLDGINDVIDYMENLSGGGAPPPLTERDLQEPLDAKAGERLSKALDERKSNDVSTSTPAVGVFFAFLFFSSISAMVIARATVFPDGMDRLR